MTSFKEDLNRTGYNLEEHKNVVSMSDLGPLLGVYNGKSRRETMRSKIENYQTPKNPNLYTKIALCFGKEMERPALEWFSREYKKKIFKVYFNTLNYNTRIGGTPDALTENKEVVEIKWRAYPTPSSAKPYDDVPESHYLQVQGYLELFDFSIGYIVCCSLNNGIHIFQIDRDLQLWDYVEKESIRFIKEMDEAKNFYEKDMLERYEMFMKKIVVKKTDKEYTKKTIQSSKDLYCKGPCKINHNF